MKQCLTTRRMMPGRVLGLALIAGLAFGCSDSSSSGGGGTPPILFVAQGNRVTLTSLDPSDPGSSQQLSVQDPNGGDVTASAAYNSRDTSVATVSTGGLIQAVNVGTTQIDISSNGVSRTISVAVEAQPDAIVAAPAGGISPTLTSIGGTLQLDVQGSFSGVSGTLDVTSQARGTAYQSTNLSIVRVDTEGLVTAVSTGRAEIVVTNRGRVSRLLVTVDAISAISLVPAGPVTIGNTGTVQLTVIGNNSSMTDLTLAAAGTTYTSSDSTIVSVGPNGLITADATNQGTAQVTATNNGLSAQITVNVVPAAIDATPATATLTSLESGGPNATVQLTVVETAINLGDVTAQASYMSSDPTTATVSAGGLVQAVNNGSATITISFQGVTDTVGITVAAVPDMVELTAAQTTLTVIGDTTSLALAGTFAGVTGTRDLTPGSRGTTYTSSDTGVATVSADGVVTAVANGTTDITATNNGVSDTLTITVDAITAIALTPAAPTTIGFGATLQLQVNGNNAAMSDVTNMSTFASSDTTIVTVDANGLVTANSVAGSADVTATFNGLTATVTLTAAPAAITATPATFDSTTVGDTQQLTVMETAIGLGDVTAMASYMSSDATVASVSAGGLITALNNGSATITVTFMGASDTVAVTVNEPPASIDIAVSGGGQAVIPTIGGTLQLQATATYANASTGDITAAASGTTYMSSDTGIATVGADGLVTSVANGTATITVTNNGVMNTFAVTVDAITAISIDPAGPVSIGFGGTQQLTVLGNNQATTDVTAMSTFMSSDTSLATVDANGLVTAGSTAGSVTITATFNGLTATVQFNPAATVIEATPDPVTITDFTAGQQLTVTRMVPTPTMDVTSQSTFMSADTTTAAVDTSGNVTAVNVGSTTVTATFQGVTDTVTVNVDVTPNTVAAAAAQTTISTIGGTSQLMVDGTFTGVTGTLDITPGARGTMYSSSDTGIATVSADGLVTAVANGTVTITVENRGVMDTIMITVDAITALNVQPAAMLQIGFGQTRQLTVLGNDQAMTDLTATSMFTSGDATLVAVDANGLLTANSTMTTGMTTISIVESTTSLTATVMVEVVAGPQTTTLAVSSTNAQPGQAVQLSVSLDTRIGDMPFGATIVLDVDSDLQISGGTGAGVTGGSAVNNATVAATANGQQVTVTITPDGTTPMQLSNGALFTIDLTVDAGAAAGMKSVAINTGMTSVQDDQGGNITIVTTDGNVGVEISTLASSDESGLLGGTISQAFTFTPATGSTIAGLSVDIDLTGTDLTTTMGQITAGAALPASATLTSSIAGSVATVTITAGATPVAFGAGVLFNVEYTVDGNAMMGMRTPVIQNLVFTDTAGGMPVGMSTAGMITANGTTLTMGNVTGAAGTTVDIPVMITVQPGRMPVGFNVDILLPTGWTITPDNGATQQTEGTLVNTALQGFFLAISRSTPASPPAPTGTVRNRLLGSQFTGNPTVFQDGLFLTLQVDIPAGAASGTFPITLEALVMTEQSSGNNLETTVVAGSVTIP